MSGFYINNLLCYYSFYMSLICHLFILLTQFKRLNTVQISRIWRVVKISRPGWGKTVWSLSSNRLFSQWTPLTQRGGHMKRGTLRPKSVRFADRVAICEGFPVCEFPLRAHSVTMNALVKGREQRTIIRSVSTAVWICWVFHFYQNSCLMAHIFRLKKFFLKIF